MSDNSSPLVTFAILAYNQVGFIEVAVNAALAQDYPNLEIIISDDCSEDDTYKIIQNIVKNYAGPHKLIINKTVENKCTLGHFFEVVDLASGDLLVLAAGDDISKPERVRRMVNVWQEKSAAGIFSRYELIDEDGHIRSELYDPHQSNFILSEVFGEVNDFGIHGASSAYDLVFLKSLPRPVGKFFFEDIFMMFMIGFFEKSIIKINDPLVYYRTHLESISNSNFIALSFSDVKAAQEKSNKYALNKHDLYVFLIDYALSSPRCNNLNLTALISYSEKLKAMASWIDCSFFTRAYYIFKYRKDKNFVKWMLPRLFGINLFSIFRSSSLYGFFEN